ncbi:MAG: septum formation initiator family protein [Micromonosporaceae bacterium]|nr:septum formation initiator family protein [Micromonosporaceae bacterium]
MAQRRTPSGQGPGRSGPRRPSASGASRGSGARGDAGRSGRGSGENSRSADRPAARRTAASRAGGAKRTRAPRPKGRFTGRAAILALVLSALVLAYAYPVRTYVSQLAQIERLSESQDAQKKRITKLEEELDKWDDPEYVRAQARSRLTYIRPDEVPYVVMDSRDSAKGEDGADDKAGAGGDAWYDRMWGSVAASDRGKRQGR